MLWWAMASEAQRCPAWEMNEADMQILNQGLILPERWLSIA